MESKTKFILVLSLFVGLALATEKPGPETMFTTSDEEYEMENHDLSKLDILITHECLKLSLGEIVDRYKAMVEDGTVDNGISIEQVEVAFNRIMTHRVMAKENGETYEDAKKRAVKEMRFRQRVLKESGLLM